jgi:3-oxoacyl-(acyl-carrier-protein) synthase
MQSSCHCRFYCGHSYFNLVAALGIRGSSTGLVSACASSGHALGMALDEIRWVGKKE